MPAKATSASVGKIASEVKPKVPRKLIDKGVIKRVAWTRFAKVRKHPISIVDLPSNTISMHVSEIPAAGKTGLHRHHNEALIFILKGRGYSEIEGKKVRWREGDALYVPPWSWHRHCNLDRSRPARYLAATNSPLLQNIGGIDRRQERRRI